MNPILEPFDNRITGRLVDVTTTEGGLSLPDTQVRGVTAFAIIDTVGPDVKRCKVGDIVVPETMGHIMTRGSTFHRVAFRESDVICRVHDLDPSMISIQGEHGRQPSSRIVMPPAGM